VESLDRSFSFYRIREALLERIQPKEVEWTELTPQDILQHLVWCVISNNLYSSALV
jgi:hypothetical protein